MQHVNEEGNVLKGLVAGLAAGFVASWTMNQFQAAWTRMAAGFEKPHGAQSMQPSEGPNPDELAKPDHAIAQNQQPQDKEDQDDATVKTAKAISEGVFGHKLTKSEKKPAGAVVHYAFGTVFWLTADEMAVPALGLAKGPTEYPVSTHAYALASHLVYGLTAELGRRAIRHVL